MSDDVIADLEDALERFTREQRHGVPWICLICGEEGKGSVLDMATHCYEKHRRVPCDPLLN